MFGFSRWRQFFRRKSILMQLGRGGKIFFYSVSFLKVRKMLAQEVQANKRLLESFSNQDQLTITALVKRRAQKVNDYK